MGSSMDWVHGVVHGPGPSGGPWTPVHVLNTSVYDGQLIYCMYSLFVIRNSLRAFCSVVSCIRLIFISPNNIIAIVGSVNIDLWR